MEFSIMSGFLSHMLAVIIGFIIGIIGSIFVEWIKRSWKKKDQKDYAKKVIQALCREIEEGIKRCRWLIDAAKENKISFSRIYIALWDSAKLRISESIEDLEVLRLLHQIYYRFDLINFNMERGAFGVGAAFAKEYIAEIEANYSSLKSKIYL